MTTLDHVHLPPAQVKILSLLAQGKQDKEIASALGTSLYTTRHQLSTMREKFGISNRVELLIEASRQGFIDSIIITPDIVI